MRLAKPLFWVGCASLFATFITLTVLFVGNRFEYEYVWQHGDLKNAIQYRVAGVWSGQQGSFLLWGVCSAVFGLLALPKAGYLTRWFGFTYSAFLSVLAGILAFESPFVLNMMDGKPIVPPDGQGLAPALQNYWVTIHPPTIFLGFGALTVPFAMAVGALATKNLQGWLPIVRPWTLIGMTLLGVGLCMGGFWAYETLGWGGFWMWDPVENTSFVPWMLIAAFTHGILVQTTRKGWIIANPLLGALPFITFVYGTFLTRSGLLADTSVHSFAQMDNTALKLLLGILGLSTLGFVALWAVRAWQMRKEVDRPSEVQGVHREAFMRVGAFLLIALAVATAIGMSMPMVMSLMGQKPKVVEEGLYHRVLPYMFIPLVVIMAAAPLVSWKGMGTKVLLGRLYGAFCLTLVGVGIAMVAASRSSWTPANDTSFVTLFFGRGLPLFPWVLFLVGLCLFATFANLIRVVELARKSPKGIGPFLSHIGVCILMTGLIVSRGLERKEQIVVQEGGHNVALGQMIMYKGMTKDVHNRDNQVLFDVVGKDGKFTARPGFYYVRTSEGGENPMVWPHIERHLFHDVYFTLHPPQSEASDPISLAVGQTTQIDQLMIRYVEPTREGEPGQQGTKFGAKIEVITNRGSMTVNPTIELGNGGIIHHDAKLGQAYTVSLASIDAASQAATLQLQFQKPIYPIEIFYKPMTILVWLGTIMLAISGFLTAWYRWPRKGGDSQPKPKPQKRGEPVGAAS